MRKPIAAIAALALLAVPTSAAAKPSDGERSSAARECRSERGDSAATREAFAVKYGTNANRRNAFGKCVSGKAKELEAAADAEDREAIAERKSAAKTCAAERTETGRTAFADKYGTNRNKRNAFGKCVSQTAKAQQDEDEQPAPTS